MWKWHWQGLWGLDMGGRLSAVSPTTVVPSTAGMGEGGVSEGAHVQLEMPQIRPWAGRRPETATGHAGLGSGSWVLGKDVGWGCWRCQPWPQRTSPEVQRRGEERRGDKYLWNLHMDAWEMSSNQACISSNDCIICKGRHIIILTTCSKWRIGRIFFQQYKSKQEIKFDAQKNKARSIAYLSPGHT